MCTKQQVWWCSGHFLTSAGKWNCVFLQVQSGANPQVCEVLAVRSLFSEADLGLQKLSVRHMVSVCSSPFSNHQDVKQLDISACVCLCGQSETPQPPALLDASPPGFPDHSASEQPRPGAAPAGPGPLQTGPPPAE